MRDGLWPTTHGTQFRYPACYFTALHSANESCYNFTVHDSLAKIASQITPNQQDDSVSGQQLVLEWAYQSVYGTLWGMRYGSGLRPEAARLLREASPQLNEEHWIEEMRARERELETFIPQDLTDEDWLIREPREISRALESLPEPDLFDRLMKSNAPRTVRKLVNQSKWLRGPRGLGLFLKEQPERFLSIRKSSRFPRSTDKQIDFLARSIGAVLARYEPSTGVRYLARLGMCEHCGERPAVMALTRGGETRSWCGAC
jgi:hypothetical protein